MTQMLNKNVEETNSLQVLLQSYRDVFKKPKHLPLHQKYDHKIVLKERSNPVKCRPYVYPLL